MRLLVLTVLLLASVLQAALGESYGDFTYTVSSNKVTITSYDGLGGRVDIPATINGLPVVDFGSSFKDSRITAITIPESVTKIGGGAFWGCNLLTSISIPQSVTDIGIVAFIGCTSLTNVTLPAGLTTISSQLFFGCSSLSSLTIPSGVTNIGLQAFFNCSNLTTLTIPRSVSYIGDNAFQSCSNLKAVYFLGDAPSKGAAIFSGITPTIYYLAGTVGWGPAFAGCPTALAGSYALTVSFEGAKGTITLNPNAPYYTSGTTVTITASPKAGYLFTAWSGASTALTTTTSVTMNQDKVLTASFNQDNSDSDGDGLTNFQESITYGSNPNLKDSNADGVEDGQAVSMGYSPTLNFSALIAHPPTGLYTANQMQAMAIGDLVLTKNANGSFTLNYDVEQSTDLQTWTPYQAFSLPMTNLPTNKAFIRIKAKQ